MKTFVYGKNTVREAIRSGAAVRLLTLGHYESDSIVKEALKANIPVLFCNDSELTKCAKNTGHQGFIAEINGFDEYSVNDLIEVGKQRENPLILILDGIEDPHNLGAILRSADAFGVDGIIMKKRGEVPLNSTVAKVSTGAIHYVRTAVVPNISAAIATLKRNGYWIVASDGSGAMSYMDVDYRGPIALIVGSEGFGISKLVLRNSDFVVKIPMEGHVNSLNASVATGILLAGVAIVRRI